MTSYHSLSPYQELTAGKSCEKIPVQPVLPADQPYKELVNLRYFPSLLADQSYKELVNLSYFPSLLADQSYKELVNLRYFPLLLADQSSIELVNLRFFFQSASGTFPDCIQPQVQVFSQTIVSLKYVLSQSFGQPKVLFCITVNLTYFPRF